jgi:trigger factor
VYEHSYQSVKTERFAGPGRTPSAWSRLARTASEGGCEPPVDLRGAEALHLDELAAPRPAGDDGDLLESDSERLGEERDELAVGAAAFGRRGDSGSPAAAVTADELAPRRSRGDGQLDSGHVRETDTLLTQWLPVRTKVEELPESRVRLEVEVPEEDVKHAIEHAASDLAASLRIPGFRKGKAPVQVVAARVGREALWDEAVRSHLDGWFWNAAATSGVRPVASPEVDVGETPPEEGQTFRFTATVAVVPRPRLGEWTELEVGAPEAEVPTELLDAELDRLRQAVAELAPADHRPAQPGDVVVIDMEGAEIGATQRDYALEVGSGRLVDEIEAALVGMSAGESKEAEFELADEEKATVTVTVKGIQEKVLPPLDDELAQAASEFETLAELRSDIEARLREQLEAELELKLRQDAVDALVAASSFDSIDPMVERRTAELATGFVRSLERRGLSLEVYLSMTGQTQEQIVGRLRAEAEQALKRELVLEAVADRLELEVTDEEIEALVREEAGENGEDPDAFLAAARDGGGFEQLRSDLRMRKALDAVVGDVKRIPVELAAAREKLWTPEKEKAPTEMKIWTPGSEGGT